ncbi:c-type cytochrome [Deinococcus sp. Arct2-2]|uniref:c-type cytochrome n=1 Tax=Deinococcus sp. Arct2-2 TaxID=2568653 RepID=UPI0010A41E77|nr:c-type cytochrome [Deinococcus sp. Arct2-2]THF67672.1 c-type cytochrome [Deinococcus sp. Arct2-2]
MSSLNRKRNNRTRWIAGDVLSWALGVTLGVLLGVGLLIVLPRTLPKPGGAAAPSTEGTIVAPAETPQAGNETQSAAANAAMGNDKNSASTAAQGEVAPTGGTRDSDIQTTPQAGMSGGDPASSESTDATRQAATNTDGGTGMSGSTDNAANTGTSDASGSGSMGTETAGAANEDNTSGAASGTGTTNTGATDANDNGAQTAAQQRANTAEDTSNTQNPDDQTGTNAGTTQGTDPDEAAARNTDPAGDPSNGRAVFASNCAGCHGANGGGNIGPALTTADGPKSWTMAEFTLTLRQGKTPERELNATMPRYSETQITDEQIADLQAYIKTLN